MEADDAFLAELVALLDGDAADGDALEDATAADAPSVAPAAASRCPQDEASLQTRGRRPPARPGSAAHTLAVLRSEAERLTQQLERARGGGQDSITQSRAVALAERWKRKRAEDECERLRGALYTQRVFVRGLRALVAVRPRFSLRLNMCRHLHRHLRLPRDPSSRWSDFDRAAHDARMHAAMDVLCRETAAATLDDDDGDRDASRLCFEYLLCEPVDDGDTESKTTTSIYTVESRELAAVARGACVAVRDVLARCPSGHALRVTRDIVDAEASAAHNLLHRVMGIHHRHAGSGDEVRLESHVVTSCKVTDEYAVVYWDYVDDDELHPNPEATNITRETTGACMIRREMCRGGVERTVVRSLYTERLRFHDRDAPLRFGCVTQEAMQRNEELFIAIVRDQVAAEETALAEAQRPVRVDASAQPM